MEDSIFTKIIKGEIPCHKVYEDEHTFAFLDIHPIQPGHVLVVPKQQSAGFIWDLESEDYHTLMQAVQKIGKRLREVLPKKKRVGIMVEGFDTTDHAHVHVFPFDTPEEYRNMADMSAEPDHEALAKMAKNLAF